MARLGCLLETISMVALFILVVFPVLPFFEDSEFFDNLLKPVLCPDGEISREQYQTYDSDGTGYSMTVSCEDNEGREKDVTGAWIGIGVAGFLIPFLIGLFMMITGINKGVGGFLGGMPMVLGNSQNNLNNLSGFDSNFGSPMPSSPANKSMSQKLQELEDAKRQGLLNEDEYQKARQEILSGS